jgi:acetylornithine deacetylase/succinyl-diaminopimelate desuccinylase-like protein
MPVLPCLILLSSTVLVAEPDWTKVNEETLRHYQTIIRFDTTDPPGHEAPAADYIRQILEAEGIPTKVFALESKRPNVVARLKGTGRKRPLLIMGHTDTVNVDPSKWKFGPFSAARDGGYIYGRGAIDDKDNVVAALMTMLLLHRSKQPLDRDVIFLAEAGEEGATRIGIQFMVDQHWAEIDAEYCLAEGGGVIRRAGKLVSMNIMTTEKVPARSRLVVRGTAGHGSVPLVDNAIARLAQALARVAAWQTPMRLNDTTRAYFEKLATISTPEQARRYNDLLHPDRAAAAQEYLRLHEPRHYSMLRTSISPTMLKGGYRMNVIPAEAEATLDIRALPDENLDTFFAEMKRQIGDDTVEIVRGPMSRRPAPPSRTDTVLFRTLETLQKKLYPGASTIPGMVTGATDMAQLRGRGVQCYGIGPMTDSEDAQKGFGAHSDQERILEEELYRFVRFHYEAVAGFARVE